jgi:hypothetical protein
VELSGVCLAVLVTGLTTAPALRAQGGPPLETDDPGTPGPGRVELNLSIEGEREADSSLYDAPRLDANLGVGTRVQLKLEVPWRVATGPTQPGRSGLGNVGLGLKWRFAESGSLAVSTYPQLTLGGSRSARAKGVADDGTALLIPIEVAWQAGPVSLNADLGYQRGEGPAALMYGLAAARSLRPTVELLGECHGSANTHFAEHGILCGAGFRWELADVSSILGAFATGVAGSAEDRPDQRWYAGVQLRW